MADHVQAGLTREYPETIRPALHIIDVKENIKRVAGMYFINQKRSLISCSLRHLLSTSCYQNVVDFTTGTTTLGETMGCAYKGIVGFIPKELGDIAHMTKLLLDNNKLQGTIPPELGKLTTLRTILLNRNDGLSGTIPPELGDIENLENLWLYGRSYDEVHDMMPTSGRIYVLDSGNDFSGTRETHERSEYLFVRAIIYGLLFATVDRNIAPILMGLKKPIHILQLGSTIREIVNMVTIAVS